MKVDLTARDIMVSDVVFFYRDTPLREIAEKLVELHISGAPVVDNEHNIVGVISESDLLNEEKRRAKIPRTALFGISVVSEELLMKAYEGGLSLKAGDLMTSPAITVTPDTSVNEIANLLVQKKINRVPVVEGNKVVGIVSREDVLRAVMSDKPFRI